ncbi:hypothetical protein ACOSQ2_009548 [Xanthoceras sorbifolium]
MIHVTQKVFLVVLNYEEHIAKYTIKVANDPRTCNRVVIYLSILHSLFVKGDLMSFELGKEDNQASKLYLDSKFTIIHQLLDIFFIDPPKPATAAFACVSCRILPNSPMNSRVKDLNVWNVLMFIMMLFSKESIQFRVS